MREIIIEYYKLKKLLEIDKIDCNNNSLKKLLSTIINYKKMNLETFLNYYNVSNILENFSDNFYIIHSKEIKIQGYKNVSTPIKFYPLKEKIDFKKINNFNSILFEQTLLELLKLINDELEKIIISNFSEEEINNILKFQNK